MAAPIFSEDSGANPLTLFGCTVKSIQAELGFDGEESRVIVTVIQEPGQDFTLNEVTTTNNGIRSVEFINFGAFRFFGNVESWSETVTDIRGSNIFEVTMRDAVNILDDVKILDCAGIHWGDPNDPNSPNGGAFRTIKSQGGVFGGVVGGFVPEKVSTTTPATDEDIAPGAAKRPIGFGDGVITIQPGDVDDCSEQGIKYDPVQQAINEAELTFGELKSRIDLTELTELINSKRVGDDPSSSARVKIGGRALATSTMIARFAKQYGFEWFLDSFQDETEDILIIKVIVIDRESQEGRLTIDDIKALHPDKIMTEKLGFENKNGLSATTMVQGGIRSVLEEFAGSDAREFWGFEPRLENVLEGGFVAPYVPFETPTYHIPGDPPGVFTETTEAEMAQALNRDLNSSVDNIKLQALKQYSKEHWGRKFYIQIDNEKFANRFVTLPPGIGLRLPRTFIDTRNSFVDVSTAGWFEKDDPPGGIDGLINNTDFLEKFATGDGRWTAFMRLPNIDSIDFGTTSKSVFDIDGNVIETIETPIVAEWDSTFNRSANILFNTDDEGNIEVFMKIGIERIANFWIITLSEPLKVKKSTDRFERVPNLDGGAIFLPNSDVRERYGPWSSVDDIPEDQRPVGRTEVIVDKTLLPWTLGSRGITHSAGMSLLNELAYSKVIVHENEDGTLSTMQLVVADIPKVNLGTPFEGGSNITNVGIQFTTGGIITTYNARFFSKTENKNKQKQKDRDPLNPPDDKDPNTPSLKELWDAIKDLAGRSHEPPTDPVLADDEDLDIDADDFLTEDDILDLLKDKTLPEISEVPETTYLYDKPEGGQGIIIGRDSGGPFYTVRRTNIRDIDPSSFKGGLVISESYFLAEWPRVRNMAEDINSPGFLPIGTSVSVSIFRTTDSDRVGTPFIEQQPPTFAPPSE